MLYVLYYNKKGGNQEGRRGGNEKIRLPQLQMTWMFMKMPKNLQKAISPDKS